ncbi:MAG TPA: glycosyltransferase family 1 protein [Patescibacteria group bacterium]|nr:glycosyltransferase family 1 protein [Patescibacteria group bacterium]
MKIFVEAHTLLQNRSGVGWFAYGLSEGLQAHLKAGDSLSLLTHPREPIDLGTLLDNDQTYHKPIDWLPARAYHSLKFHNLMPPLDLLYGKGVYIFPNFIRWPLAQAPSVIAIHDLSMYDYPEYSSPQNLAFMTRHFKRSAEQADLIMAVSEFSKRTLCDRLNIPKEKVIVTYPAVPAHYYARTDDEVRAAKAKYSIFGKYMIFVSNLEPRKNLEGIIAAYRMLPAKLKQEVSLVLVGGHGWRDDDIRNAITEARLAGDRVIQPGYVDEDDLPALYTGAEASTYVSHYEGFGIPILEAMACGTPVIGGDNTGMPESAGKAAILVDSQDFDQISHAMHELLTKPALRNKHIEAGLKQVKKFDWQKSAGKLIAALHEQHLV